jgi:hypothetical protein
MTAKKETDPEKATESAVKQVQERADAIYEQGFVGDKVDPEPNESYTLDGVTKPKS